MRRVLATCAIAFVAACGGGGEGADSVPAPAPAPASSPAPSEPAAVTTGVADSTVPPPEPQPIELAVEVMGPEEIVFDYDTANCAGSARPDLPARAFRTGDRVSVLLSHTTTHRLVGSDFDSLVLDCAPVYRSAFDHDPAAHAHHEWLAAVYTVDGTTVHGIVHNEYHGYEADLVDSRRALLTPEQDRNDWQYLSRTSDGALLPMSAAASGFAGDGLCSIDFWGAHPEVGCDAVSRWTSEQAGPLVVDIDATKVGVGGDGVTVDVRLDGVVVWNVELVDGAASADTRLALDVAIGSTIDVAVAANGDASFDATEIRTVMTPDGVRCSGGTWPCQLVELTAVSSTDGGATFAPTHDPRDLVAVPPGRYEHDAGFTAVWQPTNIVAHPDGSHVMLVQLDEHRDGDTQYSCLLRTEDVANPTAWRAWDGDGFDLAAIDPYTSGDDGPACARVAHAPISGLVWHAELDAFIAVGGFTEFGDNGHYLLASRDLLTWSDPVFIRPAEFVYSADEPPFEPYATLIDHGSPSASFDVVGSTPHLYFTRINDPETLDYDLVRIPLSLTAAE